MKAIKKIAEAVNSHSGSFIFFTLALSAFTFFTAVTGHTDL